jgi:hypothetical protein
MFQGFDRVNERASPLALSRDIEEERKRRVKLR